MNQEESRVRRHSYQEISELASELEDIYKDHSVDIPNNSYLAGNIRAAKELSDWWDQHKSVELIHVPEPSQEVMWRALSCDRLASAVRWVKEKPEVKGKLHMLLKGSINITEDGWSNAKDFEFEVNSAARLEAAGLNPKFEEPDLVFQFESQSYCIACKHPYTPNAFRNLLSKGARQIQKSTYKGIIALSLDCLRPPEMILRGGENYIIESIVSSLRSFHEDNRESIDKNLEKRKKVVGLILSLTIPCIIEYEKPLATTASQIIIFSIRGKESPYHDMLDGLATLLGGVHL